MRMSTVHLFAPVVLAALCSVASSLPATSAPAVSLKPFKDELFSGQTVLESRDKGDFQTIDYQEMRDINGRDEIPERRVKSAYVSLGVRHQQKDETLDLGDAGKLDVTRTGPADGAAFTVIFIHGRGGDRRLGADDYKFGGNFNRLKNLANDNGGTYYSPSVRSFDQSGVTQIAALIDYASAHSGGRPVVLSCASMGSFICWGLTRDERIVAKLSGMAILGGASDPDFTASAAFKHKLPMWFTHGSRDSVYAAGDQIALYERLHRTGYPTRFTLFLTGSHGTPVRMTDWRAVLNWLIR
ncbi:alpha/beta hydrolase [Agrobacterium vitis]|uniref:Alpha/beta hydrolase n=1 Tax=Agrobacterium vitis TaxID=373 RepID=A0AAE2USK1_AGRVI|nr:alpha/beta hydrolase [Agrobacterium vitis]MBF2716073.1 alpha/beta hydrolase [Agrobacterium vitis]MUZ66171.1 alpha/beta hydrolase [Agrobacterium vitis]MVA20849.1 alpha/beta hydrolase [Agrobacterium vitis]